MGRLLAEVWFEIRLFAWAFVFGCLEGPVIYDDAGWEDFVNVEEIDLEALGVRPPCRRPSSPPL